MVYSGCSPCFANRFLATRCLKHLCDEHEGVFCRKKEIPSGEYAKIGGKQRMVYSSTFALFSRIIFCSVKKWFHSLFVVFANSV